MARRPGRLGPSSPLPFRSRSPVRRCRPLHDGWRLLLGAEARARLATAETSVPATVPGCRPRRPARRRADPRPARRPQRGRAAVDRPARVDVRHDVRERGGRRRRARRGRVRRSRHVRHRDVERRRARPDREPAPHVPLRRRHGAAHRDEPPRGGVRPGREVVAAGAAPPFDGDLPERRSVSRTTTCARWPPTSAGTGARACVTAGIWRAVHLERWRSARLAAVRAHAGVRTAVPRPGRGRRRDGRRRAGACAPRRRSTGRCGSSLTVRDPDGGLVAGTAVDPGRPVRRRRR